MSKAEQVLRLASWMRASRYGVSIPEIQNRFGISRRTAERLRNEVAYLFPDIEAVDTDDSTKRWRLPAGTSIDPEGYSVDEVAALAKAADLLDHHNLASEAQRLRDVQNKIAAAIPDSAFTRMAPDVEALLDAEGFISRPGPRPRIDPEMLATLRHALKAGQRIRIDYYLRSKAKRTWIELSPYGLLHGHRHYIVGRPEGLNDPGVRLYSLPNIHDVHTIDAPVVAEPGFSFEGFVNRAFGVYQDEPKRVVWKFAPDVADIVRNYQFHPTQTLTEQPDGAVVVTFTACGELEMCWHLFTWGDAVEILEPQSLREMYVQELRRARTAAESSSDVD